MVRSVPLRKGVECAVLALLYFVAAKAGLKLALVDPSATAVWPPTGIALAALLLRGRSVWPGIFLGALAANLATAGSFATCLGIAAGNTLEGLAGAWLVTRFAGGVRAFEKPMQILSFAVLAGLVATTISATLGVSSLCLGGVDWGRFGSIWQTWWLGDAVGALLVAPPLILWGVSPRPGWSAPRALEVFLHLLITCAVGHAVFSGDSPLEFLCMLPLLLAAFRLPPRETSTATFLLASVAVAGTLQGYGPFVRPDDPNGSLLLLQAFMGFTGTAALALSSVVEERRRGDARLLRLHADLEDTVRRRTRALVEEVEERRRAEQMARESEARLAEAQRLARIGSWSWDIASGLVAWSPELYRIYGLDPGTYTPSYEGFLERVHPEDRDRVRRAVQRSVDAREPMSFEHRILRPDGTVRMLQARGRVLLDPSGRPTGMMGTGQDITEQKAALDNLVYSDVARNLQAGLCVFHLERPEDDASLVLVTANAAASALTGMPPGAESGRRLDDIAPGLRALGIPRKLADAALKGASSSQEEVWYGDARIPGSWWSYRIFPMPGRSAGLLFENVTQRRAANESLARMAAVIESSDDAIVSKSMDGVITGWNRGAERIYGWTAAEAVGKSISILAPPDAQEEVQALLERIRRGEHVTHYETVRIRKDGVRIHVSLSVSPVLDASGAVVAVSSIARDVTQAKQAQEALRLSSLRQRLILDGALDAVVTMDARGRITGWNPQAERIFGWDKSEALGRPLAETLIPPSHREAHRRGLERFRDTGEGPLLNTRIEVTALRRDGSEFPVEMAVIPVRTDGSLLFSAFIRDISDRKKAEEQVQLYADIARNIQIGFCVLKMEDPDDDRSLRLVAVNPAAVQMLKIPPGAGIGGALDELAPGIRALGIPQRLADSVRRQEASEMQEVLYGDERIAEGWWSYKAFPMPGRSVGVAFENVTVRKRAEAELKRLNETLLARTTELAQNARRMGLLNELANVLRATMSPAEAYAVVSKFAQQILPEQSGALCVQDPVRKTVETVTSWGPASSGAREFSSDDCWAFRRGRLHRVDNPRAEVLCGHLASPPPAGYLCSPVVAWGETLGILHFHHAQRPLTEDEERVVGIMTEHVALALATLRLQEKLKRQADHDPLTGLYNRRYLDKALEREMTRAAKRGSPLCVAMLDLDHFKQFNDAYGHQAGDAVLEQVGELLRSRTRGRDIACRYGGEEFTVIFPDASWPDSLHRIRQIQSEIRDLKTLSVSIGVAMYPDHAANARDLLKVADAALYKAKNEGRDRVVIGTADSLLPPVV